MIKKLVLFTLMTTSLTSFAKSSRFGECLDKSPQAQRAQGLNCRDLCVEFLSQEVVFDNLGAVKLYCASYPFSSLERSVEIVKKGGTSSFGVALRTAMNYEKATIDCALEKRSQQSQLLLDQAVMLCLK